MIRKNFRDFAWTVFLSVTALSFADSARLEGVQDNENITQEKTPEKTSRNDVQVTKKIRSQLVADDNLSLYAKNVSIVTVNGVVTLRGNVKSDQEKQMVERHARMVVQPSKIRNQLEVSPAGTAR